MKSEFLTLPQHVEHAVDNQPFTFEGGDVVLCDHVYFVGVGPRTTYSAAHSFRQVIRSLSNNEYRVILLELVHKHYYHLDTCFLPTKRFVVLAEKPSLLFGSASADIVHYLWGHNVILADNFSKDPWTLCNARYLSKENTVIFSCKPPPDFVDHLVMHDPRIKVKYVDLDQILLGGGGVSCCTLLDNRYQTLITTDPHSCNLMLHTLNHFQRDRQQRALSSFQKSTQVHISKLIYEIGDVRQVFQESCPDLRLIVLQSTVDVPESIFVKDVAIAFTDTNNITYFILAVPSCQARKPEIKWFCSTMMNVSGNASMDFRMCKSMITKI